MTKKTIIFVIAIIVVVGVAGYFAFDKKAFEKKPDQQNN
jgi:general stress protein CsbA